MTVGPDDEVVAPARVVGEDNVDAVVVLCERVDGETEPDRGPGRLHGVLEDRVQTRPGDPVHGRVLRPEQRLSRDVREHVAVGRVEAGARHRKALRDSLLGETERVEGADRVAAGWMIPTP